MEFRPIEHRDLDKIKDLADETFGFEYLTLKHINSYLSEKANFGYSLMDKDYFVGGIATKSGTKKLRPMLHFLIY